MGNKEGKIALRRKFSNKKDNSSADFLITKLLWRHTTTSSAPYIYKLHSRYFVYQVTEEVIKKLFYI
jgi:hypothetical protein